MVKKTSFHRVEPLKNPTYDHLDEIGRCVHFDDYEEALQKGFLVPQPLSNSHTRLQQKVLWFAPCQPMSSHNYYGNVTFVIQWETVLQMLGPYLYLIDQAIYNRKSFTRVVFTNNHYKKLRPVNFDFEGSPVLKNGDIFLHATHCMNKQSFGPHELQIGIEVTEAASSWLLQNCTPMANDHSLANTPFTGDNVRKKGNNSPYESYKCFKFNTAQSKECPYEFTVDECQDCMEAVAESIEERTPARRVKGRKGKRRQPRRVLTENNYIDDDDDATQDNDDYERHASHHRMRTTPRSDHGSVSRYSDDPEDEEAICCQCVIS